MSLLRQARPQYTRGPYLSLSASPLLHAAVLVEPPPFRRSVTVPHSFSTTLYSSDVWHLKTMISRWDERLTLPRSRHLRNMAVGRVRRRSVNIQSPVSMVSRARRWGFDKSWGVNF